MQNFLESKIHASSAGGTILAPLPDENHYHLRFGGGMRIITK